MKYCNFSKIILIITPWEANIRYQLHFTKLKAHYSVHKSSPLASVTSGPLCKLYHRSPMLIIIGYKFHECTSPHRTILQTTILTSNIFYSSMLQPKLYDFTCVVIPTIYTGVLIIFSPNRKETSYSDRRFWISYILFINIIGGILALFIYV